uniref:Uncharacterized protein n=1 Tax=Salix viminalis TaxID=40686 RepID=A0A6N2LSH8_SALVM
MITWEVKLAASFAGSSFEFEATKPRFRSFTATFLTLNPTLSPGRASWSASWCISTDLTSVVSPVGPKVTTVGGPLDHVITLKSRDRHEGNLVRVVTDLLQVR